MPGIDGLELMTRLRAAQPVPRPLTVALSGYGQPSDREKALAARRLGIRTVVLPAMNAADLTELPEEIRQDMTFVPVETLEQVLSVALDSPTVAATARDERTDGVRH